MANLSIKNVPDDIVERLHARAKANHRSLQGELLALASAAALNSQSAASSFAGHAAPILKQAGGPKSIEQIAAEHRASQAAPITDQPSAVELIRRDRDSR